MSDYKPGTVAKVTNDGEELIAFRVAYPADDWINAENGGLYHVGDVRPLVVIDPEDDEQAARFARGYIATHAYSTTPWDEREQEARDRIIAAVQAGFRAVAKPPKPAEPTGLGAVVEDAEGLLWVRADTNGDPWARPGSDEDDEDFWREYTDIDAVIVLSEGVQP